MRRAVDDKAIRGIPWTILSYAGGRAVMVASTIVLARLLAPSDFGLFALATLGTGFISIFSGLGLGAALVLHQDLDRRGQGTVQSLLVLAGAAFAVVLAAIAPLASALFREPRLTGVLLALAGVLSFSGVNWFYESLLQKELAFRTRFITQMVRTVVYAAVAVALAATGNGVWALVGAHISGHIAYGIALFVKAPYRVPFAWERRLVRPILSTGLGFATQDVVAFLQQNADYLVVGRVLSATQLGYYSMAYRQAEMPYYAIADPVARVTFPSFSQMRHRGEDVMPTFLGGLRMVALASLPLGVILSAAARPFTLALFGEHWAPMIGPLSVLGVWAVVRPIEVTIGWLLNSVGHAGFVGRVSLLLLAPQVVALYLAADRSGITAVSWVMLGHITVALLLVMAMTQRVTGTTVVRQWSAIQPLVLAAVASWLATRTVAGALHGSPWVALAASVVTALAVYAAGVRLLAPTLLGYAVDQAKRALGRPVTVPAVPDSA
ncbi:MAG: lipopolysaccharide biosynthesis protein [Conexibacter sp.]|nr:lipopolysaccharide biosynthesis protein [Conexibacter sp.]